MNQVAARDRIPPEVIEFVERLRQLDRGELAVLRRNAGATIAESRGATGLFYQMMPLGRKAYEEIYFLVATLYGLNDVKGFGGDFGATMRVIRQITDSASIDRRMAILLESSFDWGDGGAQGGSMAYRLRQAVKLAAGHEVGVNWAQLLVDLTHWSHPEKRAQKRWARSYYAPVEDADESSAEKA